MEEIKLKVEEKKSFINLKNLIFVVLIIVVVFLGYNMLKPKSKDRISSKVELIKILDENKLNTARYYYNGIVTKENSNGDTQYYVAYEGSVTVGLNFDEIIYEEDPVNKKIIVKIPDLQINTVNVDGDSLKFIIRNKKIKVEDIHGEAFELASEHLKNTIDTDKDFYKEAKENTKKIVQGLIEPFMKAKDSEYRLEILDK